MFKYYLDSVSELPLFNFSHLEIRKISYIDHLIVALGYAKESLLASYYFIIHGLYPDWYIVSGSNTINELQIKIQNDNKIE